MLIVMIVACVLSSADTGVDIEPSEEPPPTTPACK